MNKGATKTSRFSWSFSIKGEFNMEIAQMRNTLADMQAKINSFRGSL